MSHIGPLIRCGPEPLLIEAPDVELLQPGVDDRGPWSSNPSGWFAAGYGPLRRFGFREDYREPGPEMAARLVSLFDEDATLAESIRWLKDIHALRLEHLDRATRLGSMAAVEIQEEQADYWGQLQTSVLKLLDHHLLPEGARIVNFDMDGLWIEQNGVRLALRSLSDGYRAAIALVFDIVRQLDRCFGSLKIETGGNSVFVLHEGVVLIDEIDAHLHIEWQKRIGFWLKEHFPNIQFIVTTHSPFICQAADPRGLIRLPAPGSGQNVEHVEGEDFLTIINGGADDAAFTTLFGLENVYSDASEERRTRVAELEAMVIRGTASAADREELERLSAMLVFTTLRFNRGERVRFRPAREIAALLTEAGLRCELRPAWGRTPFSNVLVLGHKDSSGAHG